MPESFVRTYSEILPDAEMSTESNASPLPENSTARAFTPDSLLELEEDIPDGTEQSKHWVLTIDFGTTLSSVAFIVLRPGESRKLVEPDDIRYITNYPDTPSGSWGHKREVPTESWYPKSHLFQDNDLYPTSKKRPLESDDSFTEDDDHHSPQRQDEMDKREVERTLMKRRKFAVQNNQTYFWGYSVHQQLKYPDADPNQAKRIARSKLLLDTSAHTKKLRVKLKQTLEELKERKIIYRDIDIICDFLTELFRHSREQLSRHHGFQARDTVEFVVCVPVMWTRKACRIMQSVITEAIERSHLGKLNLGSPETLHILSEPEAAVASVLSLKNNIMPGDAFILLDAGGGTVDAITYILKETEPLRLEKEAVKPEGALCGSSYLNERFQDILFERLKDQKCLEINGITIEGIIQFQLIEFENQTKRTVDISKSEFAGTECFISGLEANQAKNFKNNRLVLDRQDYMRIFLPSLKEVASLMQRQLDAAEAKGISIQKVILIGGFAGSPSLCRYVEKALVRASKNLKRSIRLLCLQMPETAVASGAVLCALNRKDGPTRVIGSSYGFLCTEIYEPDIIEAHRTLRRPRIDRLDGERYVRNTIRWIVKKNDQVSSFQEFKIPVFHTFPASYNETFRCEEVLYVSDNRHQSHYRKDDPKNQDCEVAGTIVADMTFLRTEGYIKPTKAADGYGRQHYRVEYDLVMIVDGLNIRFEARWTNNGEDHVMESKQVNIAAAFVNLESDDPEM